VSFAAIPADSNNCGSVGLPIGSEEGIAVRIGGGTSLYFEAP
jgi:hypothetical protein